MIVFWGFLGTAAIVGAFCGVLALTGDPFAAFVVALVLIVGGCYAAPAEVL